MTRNKKSDLKRKPSKKYQRHNWNTHRSSRSNWMIWPAVCQTSRSNSYNNPWLVCQNQSKSRWSLNWWLKPNTEILWQLQRDKLKTWRPSKSIQSSTPSSTLWINNNNKWFWLNCSSWCQVDKSHTWSSWLKMVLMPSFLQVRRKWLTGKPSIWATLTQSLALSREEHFQRNTVSRIQDQMR